MITHSITRHVRPVKEVVASPFKNKKDYPRFIGQQGTEDHRRYLLKRALFQNPFSIYDEVIYRKKTYLVTAIIEEFEYVSWVGLSPKFIELNDISNDYYYVNPGDIKKSRRRT